MYEEKIKELENTIEQARKQIEALKEVERKQNVRYPNVGDRLYLLIDDGQVYQYKWDDLPIDKTRCDQGVLFFSKEEAEFEREKRKVIRDLELFAEPRNTIWTSHEPHFYIEWDLGCKRVSTDYYYGYKHNDIYFASKEDAEKAIDFVGEDRVKKYYLRIEGDTNE